MQGLMDHTQNNIILFDGVCKLCNGIVGFTIKRDPKANFRFAALQSERGGMLLKEFGLSSKDFDSFIYIKANNYYVKSTAGLHVLKELGGGWKLAYILIYLPRPVRDYIYDLVARTRYKVFGKLDSCMMPAEDLKHRFL